MKNDRIIAIKAGSKEIINDEDRGIKINSGGENLAINAGSGDFILDAGTGHINLSGKIIDILSDDFMIIISGKDILGKSDHPSEIRTSGDINVISGSDIALDPTLNWTQILLLILMELQIRH